MKHILLTAIAIVSLAAGAWPTLRPARLPRSEYADTEVSRCYPYDFTTKSADRLDLGIALMATPTNCFVIEIGRDLNTNGWLEATESRFVIGWDAGRWIMKGRFGTEASASGRGGAGTASVQQQVGGWVFGRHESAEATTNTLKRMVWQAWPERRRPVRLEATENGEPIFTEFATNAIPLWAWPSGWDTVRVTARGVDDPQERVKVHVMVNGTLIFVR